MEIKSLEINLLWGLVVGCLVVVFMIVLIEVYYAVR
jgi:hypothetical protein